MMSIVDERPRQRRIGDLSMPDYPALIEDWNSFFSSIFGETMTDTIGWFSRPRGLTYDIIVPEWMTLELVLKALESCMQVQNGLGNEETYELTHQRDPYRHMSYAVWHIGNESPDANLMGMHGMELHEQKIVTLTLIEYLLFHLHYFVRHEWRFHPDARTKSLCAGTENTLGNIPLAYWDGKKLVLTIASPCPQTRDMNTGARMAYASPYV
ncbi:MAG: hypothetical protein Q7S84_02340 [bacterium]|nr:hypothetical protein [bacterium]